MAKMPDTMVIEVVHDGVGPCKNTSYDGEHNFNLTVIDSKPLLYCSNCAMMVGMRFEDASGS